MLNEWNENGAIVQGENYVHMLNEHGWNWKKLILAIFAYAASFVIVVAVSMIGIGLILTVCGYGSAYWKVLVSGDFESLKYGEKIYDVILFALFPAGILANRIVFKSKKAELISFTGKARWKWIAPCSLILVPVMVVGMVIQEMINKPFEIELTSKAAITIALTFFFTPLQCMGEEMFFRGWLLQVFGPIFKNKKISWLIFGIGASIFFSVMHEPVNVFVTMSLALFGILACALIYITGGLEAGIIMHTVNNSVLFIISNLAKGGRDFTAAGAVGDAATKDAIMTMIGNVIYFLVVVWLWKRYQKKQNEEI